jgi:hypothetical protein
MDLTETALEEANSRGGEARSGGYAVSASYDAVQSRLVVELDSGVILLVPVHLVEGIAGASPETLRDIEVSPSGLGLHWPKLDADVYVPALLQGIFGTRRWMAAQLGASGGKASSPAKASAARSNGAKGGRPRKQA